MVDEVEIKSLADRHNVPYMKASLDVRSVWRHGTDAFVAFLDMLRKGESWNMAVMLACREAPRPNYSEQAFQESMRLRMEEMTPNMRKIIDMAEKAGINTHGKYYVGGLGRPTDPSAWVSDTSDVKRVCREKNLTCEGLVRHQGTPVPPKRVPLAPDLKRRLALEYLKARPDMREKYRKNPSKTLAEAEGLVVEKHGQRLS